MREVDDVVPYESRRLTPATAAGVAMVLASMAVAPAVVLLMRLPTRREAPRAALFVMISTALLTSIVAYAAPRAQTVGKAFAWCLGVAPVLGAVNVGLSLCLMELARGHLAEALKLFVLGGLLGIGIGTPVGLAFGVAFLVPSITAVSGREVASHAAVDRSLEIAGAWLLLVCASVLVALGGHAPLALPAWMAGIVGAVATTAGVVGTVRRRLWLSRVQRGLERGWAIEPRVDRPDDMHLRPFIHRRGEACWNVLVRRAEVATPYRDRADAKPVALC